MAAQEALQNSNKSIIELSYIAKVLQETGDAIKGALHSHILWIKTSEKYFIKFLRGQ